MLRFANLLFCSLLLIAAYEARASDVTLASRYEVFAAEDLDLSKVDSILTIQSNGNHFTASESSSPGTVGQGEIHGRSGKIVWPGTGRVTEFTVNLNGTWRAWSTGGGGDYRIFYVRPQKGATSAAVNAGMPAAGPSPVSIITFVCYTEVLNDVTTYTINVQDKSVSMVDKFTGLNLSVHDGQFIWLAGYTDPIKVYVKIDKDKIWFGNYLDPTDASILYRRTGQIVDVRHPAGWPCTESEQ